MTADQNNRQNAQSEPEIQVRGEELIQRLKLGDVDAWEQFVTGYGPRLRENIRRSLNKRGMSLDRADDIEQDVWRFVKNNIDVFQFQSESKTHIWLANIAYNKVRSLRHAEKRDKTISFDEIAASEEGNSPASVDSFYYRNRLYVESAEETAEAALSQVQLQQELLPILERALRELSGRDREIVVRRLIYKEKPADLAEHFNLKIANVYQIVCRAKNSMKAYLRAKGFFNSASTTTDPEEK